MAGLTRREFCRRSAMLGGSAITLPALILEACAPSQPAAAKPTIAIRLGSTLYKSNSGVDPATGKHYLGINDLLSQHFNGSASGITVSAIDIAGSSVNDQHAKIQTLLVGGQIDILGGATLWPYYQQKLLVDLTPYYKRDNWRANFVPTLFQPPIERIMYPPWASNPQTYVSVPADLSAISTAYDKQLFADFGVAPLSSTPTIDEIVSKLPNLTGKNPRTSQQCYGMYYNAGVAVHQLLYFLGRGAITFGSIDPQNPAKLQMDTPAIKSAIQEIISLAKYCPPDFVLGHGAENWGTSANTVAIALSITPQGGGSTGMLTALQNKLTNRFIVTEGIRTNGHTFYVSAGEYAIASKAKDLNAAWDVLKFLSGPIAQKFLFDNFYALPSWKNQNWLTAQNDPYGAPFLAEAAAAKEAFFPEFMFQTYRPWLNSVISNAIAGKSYNLDSGLAQMQSQAEQWVVATYTVQNGQVVPK